jgi:hypothetical protein
MLAVVFFAFRSASVLKARLLLSRSLAFAPRESISAACVTERGERL